MAITIEKKFRLDAPIEAVWSFMADPTRVAVCLPGVELGEILGADTYAGNVRVKVGPMTVAYAGEAQLIEKDDAARTFKMVGKGKEKGGAGSAKMELVAKIVEADGAVEVDVTSTIDLTGKVVRFGRGMIEAVSEQLFEEFVSNVRANLEGAREPAPLSPLDEPAADATAPPGDELPGETAEPERVESGPPPGTPETSKPPSSLARSSEPVAILPLLFKALRAIFKRFFGRIFGRGRNRQA